MASTNGANGATPREADVIVVGAGHNGLTAAAYLQKAGMDVLVVERSPTTGGMTSTNPTLPGAPDHMINEGAIGVTGIFRITTVARDLELHRHGFREIVVDPNHVQLSPDGSSLGIWTDANKTIEELRRFSHKDARAWTEMSEALWAAMDVLIPFMHVHPMKPISRDIIKALAGSARRPSKLYPLFRFLTAPHAEFLEEKFETELPKGALAAMAAFQPMTLDATAWAMIYLGIVQRIPYSMPIGGTGALPAANQRCLEHHGGKVRVNAPVEEILVSGSRCTGVRLENGEVLSARQAVVTTCSPKLVYNSLLPEGHLPDHLQVRAKGIPTTMTEATSLKINVALKGKLKLTRFEEWRGDGLNLCQNLLAWHTLDEQVKAWTDLVRGDWPDPVPVSCCTVPTATDPTQAPEGMDTFWLWSGVIPVHPRVPWEEVRDEIGQKVLDNCAEYYEGIEELEIDRAILGGPDLEERFNAPNGNVYHVDPLFMRFGPMRPALGLGNYHTPIEGFYVSGAGTHPTGGVCSLPGKLAAQSVLHDASGNSRLGGVAGRVAGLASTSKSGGRRGARERIPA